MRIARAIVIIIPVEMCQFTWMPTPRLNMSPMPLVSLSVIPDVNRIRLERTFNSNILFTQYSIPLEIGTQCTCVALHQVSISDVFYCCLY